MIKPLEDYNDSLSDLPHYFNGMFSVGSAGNVYACIIFMCSPLGVSGPEQIFSLLCSKDETVFETYFLRDLGSFI